VFTGHASCNVHYRTNNVHPFIHQAERLTKDVSILICRSLDELQTTHSAVFIFLVTTAYFNKSPDE
jgi:hypothetical protein